MHEDLSQTAGPPPQENRLRFYNPDVDQPWLKKTPPAREPPVCQRQTCCLQSCFALSSSTSRACCGSRPTRTFTPCGASSCWPCGIRASRLSRSPSSPGVPDPHALPLRRRLPGTGSQKTHGSPDVFRSRPVSMYGEGKDPSKEPPGRVGSWGVRVRRPRGAPNFLSCKMTGGGVDAAPTAAVVPQARLQKPERGRRRLLPRTRRVGGREAGPRPPRPGPKAGPRGPTGLRRALAAPPAADAAYVPIYGETSPHPSLV